MAKYGSDNTVTGGAFRGKSVQTTAVALPMPVVLYSDLAKKSHPVNIARYSGKQLGAMVCVQKNDGKLNVAIASGDKPESPWYLVEPEQTPITPAAQ